MRQQRHSGTRRYRQIGSPVSAASNLHPPELSEFRGCACSGGSGMWCVARRSREWVLLLFLLPAAGQAQAPVITATGDPSIRNDSVYALAVDSVTHAGEPY